MAGIFGIGISGIQAAQLGMVVTQHNITNSNTPGYNRQSVIQSTAIPLGTSLGFAGNGVQVTTIARQYNSFLSDQVRQSETELSSLDSYFSQIQVIDDLLADANAGVSPALQEFFKGVQQVAAAPASLPARQSMVSAAQSLVSRLQGADQRISDLYGQVNQQVADTVSLINTYGQQIANLNERITVAQSAVNQPANDLLDQRDQLISDLNKLVKVQTVPIGNGGIEVFIGKGQLLVMGNRASEMSAVRSSEDPSRITVALDTGSGQLELPDGVISGGELGGLLDFRRETLDKAVNSLGKVAASLALTFNAQHGVGMDMLGNNDPDPGFVADFFTIPSPKVIPSNPSGTIITASFTAPIQSDLTTTGNFFTDLTNSDYQLKYDAGNFTLTRLSDSVTWSGADIATINAQITDRSDPRGAQGFTLDDGGAGVYTDGDSYLIQPTREIAKNISIDARIAGDVRLIAAGSPIRAAVGLTNQGSMSVAVQRMISANPSLSYPIQVTVAGADFAFDPAYNGQFVTVTDSNGSSVYEIGVDAVPRVAGATYELDGVLFSVKGNPQNGDTFTLDWNDGQTGSIGVSDSSNILLLGKLQTQNTMDGGTVSYQGAYAQLVSDIGNKAREVEVTKDAQQSLVDQAAAARNAESGVNLDEEAANLLKYQQLYQAAARSISVGQKLFDELLSIAAG